MVACHPMRSCSVAASSVRAVKFWRKVFVWDAIVSSRHACMSGWVFRFSSLVSRSSSPSLALSLATCDWQVMTCLVVSWSSPHKGQLWWSQKFHQCIHLPTAHWPQAFLVTHSLNSCGATFIALAIASWSTSSNASCDSLLFLSSDSCIAGEKICCRSFSS